MKFWIGISLLPLLAASLLFGQTLPLDQIEGPVICVFPQGGGNPVPLPPTFVRYNAIITDGVAQTKITQVFDNSFADAKDMIYTFPLPHDGAVHAMSLQVGDSLFRAQILEKGEAQRRYDSLVAAGGQGALLTQTRPNIFQQRIARLEQGRRALVEIVVSQPLKYLDGVFEYTMPTRVAARYGSDLGSGWNPPADVDGTSLQFNVVIQGGFPIEGLSSPTHPLLAQAYDEARPELLNRAVIVADKPADFAEAHAVFLKSVDAYPNRDFVLRFSRAKEENDFSVASYRGPGADSGTFSFTVFPNPGLTEGERDDLEVVLLVDVSGSQSGWPLVKEKEIAQTILSKLKSTDRLSVLSFHDFVVNAFPDGIPVPASSENLAKAKSFVQGLVVGGGTNLIAGIRAALAQPQTSEHQRLYVFLTDGFITNEAEIFSELRNHSSHPTIFTFGAGSNLNRSFLETSAEIGHGFATEILASESAETKTEEAWARIETPQIKSLSFDFGGAHVDQIEKPTSSSLFRGQPYTLYGRYVGGGDFTFALTGDRNGTPIRLERTVTLSGEGGLGSAVEKLWARKKIGRLDLEEGTTHANQAAIVALSLKHQVLTEYTAFLAIEPQIVTEETDLRGGMTTGLERKKPEIGKLAFLLMLQGDMLALQVDPSLGILAVEVYDLNGKRYPLPGIARGRRAAGPILLGKMESWKPGHYLLAVRTNRGMMTVRFAVMPGGRLAVG